MGAKFTVEGKVFQIRDYTISEDTTPLAAGDTFGSTGELTVELAPIDPDLSRMSNSAGAWITTYGRDILLGKTCLFEDSFLGTLEGTISTVGSTAYGTLSITCLTSQSKLNIYNVQARPFVGTLGALLRYYCTLAGTSTPTIDTNLNVRSVAVPGWTGELWYHLKMLAVAQDFEIALVNGRPTFRELRQRTIPRAQDIERGGSLPIPTLAQTVECYQYNNEPITNSLVYPPGGWSPDVEILNVNAGEEIEYTLELSSSVSSISQPVAVSNVPRDYDAASRYTVVGSDGLIVPPALWAANGGLLQVSINEDTTSLNVRLRGATRIPTIQGVWSTNFQIAMAADTSSSRYSTLRILGTGVAFDRVKRTFRTGVTPQQTGTVVGETIDNLFLGTTDQCYRAGTRAALRFSGPVPQMDMTLPQQVPGMTLGLVAGSRVFNPETKRFLRVRSTTFTPGTLSGGADDDLTHDDIDVFHSGKTYGQVQVLREGVSYRDDYLMGLR